MIGNKDCRHNIKRNKKAASPAISMVIITAATVVLVMVSSGFALQALERQQASAEFDTVQKSVLAFDDAVRDIAWDVGGSRSVRFTTNYGNMRLIATDKTFQISGPMLSYSFNTSVIQYQMSSGYISLGNGYSSYVLGDEGNLVSSLTDSFAQVLVSQEKSFASVALNYRVRVSREGPSIIVNGQSITYVDILVIRLNSTSVAIGSGNFDLTAKNVGLNTESYRATVSVGDRITVNSGGVESHIQLDAGEYMFNLIIADVQVKF